MPSLEFVPIGAPDQPFLYSVYAATRAAEMALVPWDASQKEQFLRFQFDAQHAHYVGEYPTARFCKIMLDGVAVGRLYTSDPTEPDLRIIDLALLPEHQNLGVEAGIIKELVEASSGKISTYLGFDDPLIPVYESLGFRPVAEDGFYKLWEHQRREASGAIS